MHRNEIQKNIPDVSQSGNNKNITGKEKKETNC